MKIKCPKCGYKWDTKSKLIKVSCPSCGDKVFREKQEVKEDDVN